MLALLTALPMHAQAACDLATAAPLLPMGGDAWLAGAPPKVAEQLRETGIVYPLPGIVGSCSELVPAVVLFAHSAPRVFALLGQTERQTEVLKLVSSIQVVSREPGAHVDRHEIHVLFRSIRYHIRYRPDAGALRIWWELSPDHPNDIRSVTGYWELYPLADDRSLGLYASAVDVGPVLPKRMQDALTRKNLKQAVVGFRRWVDEMGAR
jgi:hypothetical protein